MTIPASSRPFTERVLRFYRARQRDLPWRKTRDPYAIWVSEIMLQQTRVAAVIPYWQAWMERFPTARALAEASEDDVMACWSGLGYYRRARNLHAGAREVVAHYGGSLPQTASDLLRIPGIGRYTAGAIASIAFGKPEPLVDGNVARVLARVYGIESDIKKSATVKQLWQLAGELVPNHAAGDYNQGLMELGATVCLPPPAEPSCRSCPVRQLCVANKTGRQRELPVVSPRLADKDKPVLAQWAIWAARGGKLLLGHRAAGGLYGGLWELPQASDRAELSAWLSSVDLGVTVASDQPVVRHRQILSHRQLHIDVYPADIAGRLRRAPTGPYQRLAWHAQSALDRVGVAKATRAIIQRYRENTNV